MGPSGPAASSPERRVRTLPGSTGPMPSRSGSRRGAASAGTIWPTPLTLGWAIATSCVYLMLVQHIPVQRCVQLLESLTGATPSAGFVHGMLTRAAGLPAEVDKRIRALITLAYAVCADETPLRVGPRWSGCSRRPWART